MERLLRPWGNTALTAIAFYYIMIWYWQMFSSLCLLRNTHLLSKDVLNTLSRLALNISDHSLFQTYINYCRKRSWPHLSWSRPVVNMDLFLAIAWSPIVRCIRTPRSDAPAKKYSVCYRSRMSFPRTSLASGLPVLPSYAAEKEWHTSEYKIWWQTNVIRDPRLDNRFCRPDKAFQHHFSLYPRWLSRTCHQDLPHQTLSIWNI